MDPVISNLGQTIIGLLKKHNQIGKLPELIRFLQTYSQTDTARPVIVISSTKLNPQQKQLLTSIIRQKINHNIPIKFQTDPNLIGGLLIRYQDKILDLSIKGRLNKIKQELSYE